ncbi:MAG TPA: hypothetical protein VFJ93_10885 [Gaiellaceae bacterium]|nr:hypothetical protein [Gaiellaceae bacterium]
MIERLRRWSLAHVGVVFLFVACTFTYYGQLHRTQSGDVYGTVYTAVALVEKQTIWLDSYLPYIQERSGEQPYMLTTSSSGHVVTATPTASSVLAVPAVALFALAGVHAGDFGAWLEAGMLTAALAGAATVALLFVLLTRLTTRPRALLISATYAWGTIAWGINAQALWQHGGVALSLTVALIALVDRRLALAGAALTAMAAFRLTTPFIAICLLPLVGRRPRDWGRFLLGAVPLPLALATYNVAAFGSPLKQGYGTGHIQASLQVSGRVFEGLAGLLIAPGRGLFVYSPVLLFAVVGAVRGRRVALYRAAAAAIVLYILVTANVQQWWGGESFGPRKLSDILPLFALLLVPAIDLLARPLWRRIFVIALAWSVLVELLAAAAWPTHWFDTHDLTRFSTWWNPWDNEVVDMLTSGSTWPRVAWMVLIAASGLVAAALAQWTWSSLARRPAVNTSLPARPRS